LATLAGLLTGVFVAWFRAKSLSRDCKTDWFVMGITFLIRLLTLKSNA
jgi:hypothetical protein